MDFPYSPYSHIVFCDLPGFYPRFLTLQRTFQGKPEGGKVKTCQQREILHKQTSQIGSKVIYLGQEVWYFHICPTFNEQEPWQRSISGSTPWPCLGFLARCCHQKCYRTESLGCTRFNVPLIPETTDMLLCWTCQNKPSWGPAWQVQVVVNVVPVHMKPQCPQVTKAWSHVLKINRLRYLAKPSKVNPNVVIHT